MPKEVERALNASERAQILAKLQAKILEGRGHQMAYLADGRCSGVVTSGSGVSGPCRLACAGWEGGQRGDRCLAVDEHTEKEYFREGGEKVRKNKLNYHMGSSEWPTFNLLKFMFSPPFFLNFYFGPPVSNFFAI